MKILNCPLNGPRNVSEFICLGEVKSLPPPTADTGLWAEYVFIERNPAGRVREWWLHIATNYIFIVDRDTHTDDVLNTYCIGDPRLIHTAPPDEVSR